MGALSALGSGDQVGPFVLGDVLGEGGMSRVFAAQDTVLDRRVALKVLAPSEDDEEDRARFLREAKALARIDHPNVVRVFSSGVDEERGLFWMALQLVEGQNLGSLLGSEPFDEVTALLLAAQVARGLGAVHAEGVIHRDIKPENLLLDEKGQLLISDFSVARLLDSSGGFVTRQGVAVGTPHFMSPEQAKGQGVDQRADVWGLGATLFMMLTGKPPFFLDPEETDAEILARILRDPTPDVRKTLADLAAPTAQLVGLLLAKDAKERPGDCDAVANSLEALADQLESGAVHHHADAPLANVANVAVEAVEASEAPESDAAQSVEASSPATSSLEPAENDTTKNLLVVFAVGLVLLTLGGFGISLLFSQPQSPPAKEDPKTVALAPDAGPAPTPDAGSGNDSILAATENADSGVANADADSGIKTIADVATLVAQATRGDGESEKAIAELLARDEADARAAISGMLKGEKDLSLSVTRHILERRSVVHLGLLEVALLERRDPGHIARLINLVADSKMLEGFQMLDRLSMRHKNAKVRAEAAVAKRRIFSVEEGAP
jgi:serine/threonine-protein kinase